MKRNMDMVRDILLAIERDFGPKIEARELSIPVWAEGAVSAQVKQMLDAGLVNGIDMTASDNTYPEVHVSGLTWEGAEFLDAIRGDSIWAAVKGRVADAGGSIPLDVMKAFAIGYAKQRLVMDDS